MLDKRYLCLCVHVYVDNLRVCLSGTVERKATQGLLLLYVYICYVVFYLHSLGVYISLLKIPSNHCRGSGLVLFVCNNQLPTSSLDSIFLGKGLILTFIPIYLSTFIYLYTTIQQCLKFQPFEHLSDPLTTIVIHHYSINPQDVSPCQQQFPS